MYEYTICIHIHIYVYAYVRKYVYIYIYMMYTYIPRRDGHFVSFMAPDLFCSFNLTLTSWTTCCWLMFVCDHTLLSTG